MMFEEYANAIPSIWSSSMNTLLSPVVPFVLLNVMIGIIAFSSKLANKTKYINNQPDHSHQNQQNQQNHSHHHHHNNNNNNNHNNNNNNQQQQQFQQKRNWLTKSPSIILERVRSINLYSNKSHQEPNLVTSSTTNFSFEHVQNHENSSQYIFERPHQENTPQQQVHVKYTFEDTQEEENSQKSNANVKQFVSIHHDNAEHLKQSQQQQQREQQDEEEEEEEEEEEDVFEEEDDELVYANSSSLNHLMRTKSDTEPCSGEATQKLPTKIRKSASMKSSFGHFEEEDIIVVRPETMREKGSAKMTEMEDGVDAKADDFISMFRNQLKLQRMDSIIRYKEMITRGSEK